MRFPKNAHADLYGACSPHWNRPFSRRSNPQWNNLFSLIPWGSNFPIVTMALRECKECGRSVSTTAPSCPQCGAADPTGEIRQRSHIVSSWVLVATFALFAMFSLYIHSQQNDLIDEYAAITAQLVAQRDSLVTICSRRR